MSASRSTRRPLVRIAVALACAAALAACSGTTDGEGSAQSAGSTADETTASTSSESAETTEPTETTESDDGPRTELACDGDNVLAPDGQPFCVEIPDGFTQTDITTDNEAGTSSAYSTGLAVAAEDILLFNVYPLTQDTDAAADEDLASALAPIISQLAAQGFTFDSQQPEVRDANGSRAFFYTGSDNTGRFSDIYFIFAGSTELQITCQWTDQEDVVLQGCQEVLDGVQIVSS